MIKKYYKLAQPDGWDFFTGKTINYRNNIGKVISIKNLGKYELCSNSVIHASDNPNDCFVGASIPCSAYLVSGTPVVEGEDKCGFVSLRVIREIKNLNHLFGWKYSEAANPIHPLKITPPEIAKEEIKLLEKWASVRASVGTFVWDSVWASIRASIRASLWDSIWASVGTFVRVSVGASVRTSVRTSVEDSVGAYIGSFFKIDTWKYIKHKKGIYPFQSAVDLWKRGLIPSFDGGKWRLHGGEKAEILYEMEAKP